MTGPTCPYCQKAAERVTGDELYSQRIDLGGKFFWVCWDCDARVGCHPGTMKPLGTLANQELRALRGSVHRVFDPHWLTAKRKRVARLEAYARLTTDLAIRKDECHIAMFDEVRCRAALVAVAQWEPV